MPLQYVVSFPRAPQNHSPGIALAALQGPQKPAQRAVGDDRFNHPLGTHNLKRAKTCTTRGW
nr:hypothetical protein [Ktedonobacteraceae bacterium]